MKKIGFLLFIIQGLNLYCQDSIHFYSNEIIVAKVTEIGIDEIAYNRYDNMNGPVYHIGKDKIHFIKYENGLIDTFKLSKKQLDINSTTRDNLNTLNSKFKISIVENHLEYKNQVLNNRKFFKLINTYANAEKKTLLLRDFKLMKKYKLIYRLTFPVGLGLGLAAIVLPSASALLIERQANYYMAVGIGIGAAILATSIPISIIHKKKFLKKREEMVQLFNTL